MNALAQTQEEVQMIGTKLEVSCVAVGALMEQMWTIEENKRRERKMSEITIEEVEEINVNFQQTQQQPTGGGTAMEMIRMNNMKGNTTKTKQGL